MTQLTKTQAALIANAGPREDGALLPAPEGIAGKILDRALGALVTKGLVTSPYDGTALIAAAHLGHVEVVRRLIDAGSPLDHINNLHWTAVMEAVVLGDGGEDHQAVLDALLDAGADRTLADREGVTPLEHAEMRGFAAMVERLESFD